MINHRFNNKSFNGTDYDDMSMESLRARRAQLEAKRRQLEILDRQRMRDAKSLSGAHYMTLKRARSKLEKKAEIATQRNQKLSRAFEDLVSNHANVVEDRSYLSRAMGRYKVRHGGIHFEYFFCEIR